MSEIPVDGRLRWGLPRPPPHIMPTHGHPHLWRTAPISRWLAELGARQPRHLPAPSSNPGRTTCATLRPAAPPWLLGPQGPPVAPSQFQAGATRATRGGSRRFDLLPVLASHVAVSHGATHGDQGRHGRDMLHLKRSNGQTVQRPNGQTGALAKGVRGWAPPRASGGSPARFAPPTRGQGWDTQAGPTPPPLVNDPR